MNLTDDDLQAIGLIVRPIIADEIGKAIEESDQRAAAGFAEVHEKIDAMQEDLSGVKADLSSVKDDLSGVKDDLDSVKQTVERIERIQRAEVERVDSHGTAINEIRKAMQAV